VSPELVESVYVWELVGYLLWPKAARHFLSKLPVDMPVDNWIALMSACGELKAYCVRPTIIRQASSYNVDSNIKHSIDSVNTSG